MTGLLLAVCSGAGTYLLFSHLALGRRRMFDRASRRAAAGTAGHWLRQAGLGDLRWREFGTVCVTLAIAGFLLSFAIFGGAVPGIIVAVSGGIWPVLAYRSRRARRDALAQDSWPRMIEEIRVLVANTGMSIPQALFVVGRRAPEALAEAFDDAHREWLLSTDFHRAIALLKDALAHPTADVACETLLTAHDVGGIDLDRRLADLAEDRLADVQARKDARARQAGARFARGFVVLVPIGMALVGLSIGSGRAAYQGPVGQILVAFGLLIMVACWIWAGQIMRIPAEQRVFSR